ncbi:hypothetical protein TWF718_010485 [Orbilia javanica]|uniref:Uncharacterized protein n=1 Tax=Orbilia javanica TaxID=47235 RepID=A0AAN8MYE5_9PEZI
MKDLDALTPLITNTTQETEAKFQQQVKALKEEIVQKKRKYICASCERDPKKLEIVESNKMKSCYFCHKNAEMQKLSKIAKKHETDITRLNNTVKENKIIVEKLQMALKSKEGEVAMLKERVQAQTRELGSLEMDYERTKADYQRNEAEIKKLQQTESALRRQGDVLMDEEAKIKILDILRTKIKAIGRVYLKSVQWNNVLASNDEQELKNELGQVFTSAWHPDNWPLVRDHPSMTTQVLVIALLSSTISKFFFQNPFFRAGEARNILDDIYTKALSNSPQTAIVWRAKTNNLLNELVYDRNMVDTIASDIVIKRIFNSILRLIQTNNPLEENKVDDLFNKIADLVQSSITLATNWHAREFHFVVISFEWLYYMRIDVYSEETAKYVTPFPPNRKIEEGKTYGILAVISPGFLRYLKVDGETEFQEIVWEKAFVLLSEYPV